MAKNPESFSSGPQHFESGKKRKKADRTIFLPSPDEINDDLRIVIQGQLELFFSPKEKKKLKMVLVDDVIVRPSHDIEGIFEYVDRDDVDQFPQIITGNDESRRILLYATITPVSKEILFSGLTETNPLVHGKGLGLIYQQRLKEFAITAGYRFVAGSQNEEGLARFFLNRGRFLMDDIKPDYLQFFKPAIDAGTESDITYMTIWFLDDADIEEFVLPERQQMSVDDRLLFASSRICANRLIDNIPTQIDEFMDLLGYRRERIANMIERLDLLDLLLPSNEQSGSDLPMTSINELMKDLPGTLQKLRALYDHVEVRRQMAIDVMTAEDIDLFRHTSLSY